MKPWVRFVFIFIAYGIALLHTAVPHHHGAARKGDVMFMHAGCHYSHSGGGLLQKVLSTDLGYGHLENFKKGGDTEISFSSGFVAIIAPVVPTTGLSAGFRSVPESLDGYIEKLKKRLLLFSVTQLRAPPACS